MMDFQNEMDCPSNSRLVALLCFAVIRISADPLYGRHVEQGEERTIKVLY